MPTFNRGFIINSEGHCLECPLDRFHRDLSDIILEIISENMSERSPGVNNTKDSRVSRREDISREEILSNGHCKWYRCSALTKVR